MLKFFRRTRVSALSPSAPASLRSNTRRPARFVAGLALLAAPLLCLHAANAQSTPMTPFDRFADKFELGVSASGEITKDTAGPVLATAASNYGFNLTLKPSTTVGYLVNLRYTAKPYVGLELNYDVARYTENFNYAPVTVQTQAAEYTIGYVIHPPHVFFGLHPFVSGGAGATAFRPTKGGGEGLPNKARMTYFGDAGVTHPSTTTSVSACSSARSSSWRRTTARTT